MRTFWLLPKKRRRRRTGSEAAGGLALAAFFSVCALGGLGFLWLIVSSLLVPQWRVNRVYRPVECQIVDQKLEENDDESGVSFRPRLLIRYQVGEQWHQVWTYDIGGVYSADREAQQAVVDRFPVGGKFPAWYDPGAPGTAVLVRGYTWFAWLMLFLPASFITLGGAGLVYTLVNLGKSTERRAAMAPIPTALELIEPGHSSADSAFPTVPGDGNLVNSPGTQLRYRMPSRTNPLWRLGLLGGAAATVLAAAMLFGWMAAQQILAGQPDWFLTLFCLPWVTVGSILAIQFAGQLMFHAQAGGTIVEISDHPLVLGERYRVLLMQGGRLKFRSLRLLLVCEERATYQQGTNTRTYARRVFEALLVNQETFGARAGAPAEWQAELELPELGMHSFRGLHNEVAWSIVVRGEPERWPPFEYVFPLVVYPAGTVLQRQ